MTYRGTQRQSPALCVVRMILNDSDIVVWSLDAELHQNGSYSTPRIKHEAYYAGHGDRRRYVRCFGKTRTPRPDAPCTPAQARGLTACCARSESSRPRVHPPCTSKPMRKPRLVDGSPFRVHQAASRYLCCLACSRSEPCSS